MNRCAKYWEVEGFILKVIAVIVERSSAINAGTTQL
jgi:hypothetical protein